jgi:hypothetical protein
MTSPSAGTLPIPTLVSWGSAHDTYYGQDFDALSRAMSQTLSARGHAVVVCSHGNGHNLESSFWKWALKLMEDHPRGIRELAYDDGLPADYIERMSAGGCSLLAGRLHDADPLRHHVHRVGAAGLAGLTDL